MLSNILLSVFTIPSGFYILIGFFALIVLAIVLWSSPKHTRDKGENLKHEPVDTIESKE